MDKTAFVDEAIELIETNDAYIHDAAAKQGRTANEVPRDALVEMVADALFEDFRKGKRTFVAGSDTPEEAVSLMFDGLDERIEEHKKGTGG